ncbi:MAG: hypothetical protein AAF539_16405 [Planctomycetota bacterium]
MGDDDFDSAEACAADVIAKAAEAVDARVKKVRRGVVIRKPSEN